VLAFERSEIGRFFALPNGCLSVLFGMSRELQEVVLRLAGGGWSCAQIARLLRLHRKDVVEVIRDAAKQSSPPSKGDKRRKRPGSIRRRKSGQFAKGNRGGPGRPPVAKCRPPEIDLVNEDGTLNDQAIDEIFFNLEELM